MKTALITTTINVPHVLKLYRACSADVRFFIAADMKTPLDANLLAGEIKNAWCIFPEMQKDWKCSELIGWNTIARRNIALLEALKWGADLIVSVDDDNLPISTDYFDRYEMVLATSVSNRDPRIKYRTDALFSGCSIRGFNGWFDPGQLGYPNGDSAQVTQRGFPHEKQGLWGVKPVVDVKVGVAQGMILGDPDTSAVDRIAWRPEVHRVSELARSGVVLDPNTWAPLNSQNIAFIRELAPCFLMVPPWKRYDDIFASLVAQKIMRERGLHVHLGQPFVWQQRNKHDLNKDLAAELWGMQHAVKFAELLDSIPLPGKSVVDDLRVLWNAIALAQWMPEGVWALADAWLRDLEQIA